MLKSLSLATYNWKVLVKALVCQVLVLALAIALCYTAFGGVVDGIVEVFTESGLKDFAYQTVNSIIDGTFDSDGFLENLNAVIRSLLSSIEKIGNFWGDVTWSYIVFVLVICVYRMLVAITDVTVACQLDEFMTSNAVRPFSWYFFKKQGRTWKFVLLQLAVGMPMDVLIATGCIGFYLMFLIAFRWWTIVPISVLLVLLYTVRLTYCAFCLPSVACENDLSTRKAFKNGLSSVIGRFWNVFWKTLIVVALIVTISVLSLLYVTNPVVSVVLTTVPNFLLFFYLKCVNMVEYFNATGKPYFYKRVDIEGTERYLKKKNRREKRENRKKKTV